jgi:hypothetical protein
MGKLCRIRLLRPDDGLKVKEEGVSDNELAVLTGSAADHKPLTQKKKPALLRGKKAREKA